MGFYNYVAARLRCHRQIVKYSLSKGRLLGVTDNSRDRDCWVGVIDYKPTEAGLREEGARRALISALVNTTTVLNPVPDHNEDKLVWNGEVHRITKPIVGPRPAGVAIFYDAEIVFEREAT